MIDLTKSGITLDNCLSMEVEDFKGWLDEAVSYRTDMNKAIAEANAEAAAEDDDD